MGAESFQYFSNSVEHVIAMFPLVPLLELNCLSTALTLTIMSLFLIYLKQQKDKILSKKAKLQKKNLKPLPTPPKLPILDMIIGHMYLLRDYQDNPWDGLDAIRREFGNIVGLKFGVHPMCLVSDIKIMREVLLEKGEIFANRPNFPRHHIIFGGDRENSLALCSWTNVHKDRRKFCKRGIAPNKLSSRSRLLESVVFRFVGKFTDKFAQEIAHKQQVATTNPIDPCMTPPNLNSSRTYTVATKTDILFLTSDIFLEYLCGEKHPHSNPEYGKFNYGCDSVFWEINQSYLIDFLPYLTKTVGFFYLRHLQKMTDFARNFIDDKIFNPRMELLRKQDNLNETDTDYLNSIIKDYLSGTNSMSLADYRVGFEDLLAGHAAVANILMRILGHLSLSPEIQDLIYEEAKEADILILDKMPSLPITEAAVQEALRLASSPIVPHVACQDTSLGEYFVPEGTMILFNLYHLNLSKEFWSDPIEYNPMRLIEVTIDKSGNKIHKLNPPKYFMPFSQGLRQCLGFKMVETISIVAVASLCRRYRIKANDENLVKRLLIPKGSLALNPDADCYDLHLFTR